MRNFRLQKKKFVAGFDTDSSQELSQPSNSVSQGSGSTSVEESPIRQAGYKKRVLDDRVTPEPSQSVNGENGYSDPKPPAHKRIRMISDSESENGSSPTKVDNNLPLPEDIERKVNFLKNACPSVDQMVLQDTLKAHDWNVDWAIESLAPKDKPKAKSPSKVDKGIYINKR